jgi:hypothetical protein
MGFFPLLSLGLQKKKRGGERGMREGKKMGGGPEIKRGRREEDHAEGSRWRGDSARSRSLCERKTTGEGRKGRTDSRKKKRARAEREWPSRPEGKRRWAGSAAGKRKRERAGGEGEGLLEG